LLTGIIAWVLGGSIVCVAMASFASSPDGGGGGTLFPFGAGGILIVSDADKGRCLQNLQPRVAGEVLFTEDALVWSSFAEDSGPHVNKDLLHRAFGPKNFKQLDTLHEELSELDQIASLDNARNFLQLVSILFLQSELATGGDAELLAKLSLLSALDASPSHRQKCIEDIRCFRHAYPKVLPSSLSDEQAGHILGVLLTNQLELESFGGSGLFVGTAIMEHSCDFNCSYTTRGNRVFMTATRDIAPGERLSIDYGNFFYQPTSERQQSLYDSYGFVCSCRLCLGPDRKRAFWCQTCASQQREGIFCPDASILSGEWPCLVCGTIVEAAHRDACLEREAFILANQPQSVAEIEAAGKEGLLHESHHLLFSAISDLAMASADEAKRQCSQVDSVLWPSLFAEPLAAFGVCCRLMEQALPAVHREKCIYLDRLGQIAVCAGSRAIAVDAYGRAYQMSCLAGGRETPETLELFELATKTPLSMAGLLEHYAARQGGGGGEDEEEEVWEDMEEG